MWDLLSLKKKKNKNERKIYLVLQHNIKCLVYISITNLDTWVLDFLLLGSYEVYKNKNNFFLKKISFPFCIKESLGPNFEKNAAQLNQFKNQTTCVTLSFKWPHSNPESIHFLPYLFLCLLHWVCPSGVGSEDALEHAGLCVG